MDNVFEKTGVIALINLIVYYRTLFYGYVGDDLERSQRTEPVFKNWRHRWWIQFIGLRHTNSMVAHFITLWTHTICCALIYLALGCNNVSFLTALLFSINPINIQGSVWISGRNYVTSTILTLLMFIHPLVSIIPYYFTSFFAVNAWFAPLAFLWTPYWYLSLMIPLVFFFTKHNKSTLKRKLWETGGVKTTNAEMRAVKPDKLIIFLKCFGYYFRLCLFPYITGIDHKFMYGFGTNQTDNKKGYSLDKDFCIGLICAVMPFLAYFMGYRRVGWGLWWFAVNIAMWCNFITIQQQIGQRYVYLANVGMMFAVSSLIVNYPILISIVITAYMVRLWYIMPSYINDYWAVEHCVMENKNFHYIWIMRGVKKYFNKDFPGAMLDFMEAYKYKPYDFKVCYNIAALSLVLGNVPQSRQFITLAKENIYDEMEGEANNPIIGLEKVITEVEVTLKSSPNFNLDLNRIMVVK